MYDKDELIKDMLLISEALGLKSVTEETLDNIQTKWSYNPFSGNPKYLFKVSEGILSIPTAYSGANGEYLDIDKAYIASDDEIHNALALLKQCYEEILSFVKCDFK